MASKQETHLDVGGMTCRSCVFHVETALRELDGVETVDVKLAEGSVRVGHDPAHASVAALVAALAEAGYEAAASPR